MSNLRFPPKLCRPKPPAECHQVRARAVWRAGWSRADAQEPQASRVGRRGRVPDQPPTYPHLTPASWVPKSPKWASKLVQPRGEEGLGNEQKHFWHNTQVIHEHWIAKHNTWSTCMKCYLLHPCFIFSDVLPCIWTWVSRCCQASQASNSLRFLPVPTVQAAQFQLRQTTLLHIQHQKVILSTQDIKTGNIGDSWCCCWRKGLLCNNQHRVSCADLNSVPLTLTWESREIQRSANPHCE